MVFTVEVEEMASPTNPHAHSGAGVLRGETENFPINTLDFIQGQGEEYPEGEDSVTVQKNWNKLLGVLPCNIRSIAQAAFGLQMQIEAYAYLIEPPSINAFLTTVLQNWPDRVNTRRNGTFEHQTGVSLTTVEVEFADYITTTPNNRKKLELCKKIRVAKQWSSRRSKRSNMLHLMEIMKIGRKEMGWESRKFWDPLMLATERVLDVLTFVEPRFKQRFNRFNLGVPYRWSMLMNSTEPRTKKAGGQLTTTTRRRMNTPMAQEMQNTNRVIGQYLDDNEPEPRDLPQGWEQVGEWDNQEPAGPAFPDASWDNGLDGDIWDREISFPVEDPGDAFILENDFMAGRINDTYISEMSPQERQEWIERSQNRQNNEDDESEEEEVDSRETITEIVYLPGAELRPLVTRYREGYHPGTDRRISEEEMRE